MDLQIYQYMSIGPTTLLFLPPPPPPFEFKQTALIEHLGTRLAIPQINRAC